MPSARRISCALAVRLAALDAQELPAILQRLADGRGYAIAHVQRSGHAPSAGSGHCLAEHQIERGRDESALHEAVQTLVTRVVDDVREDAVVVEADQQWWRHGIGETHERMRAAAVRPDPLIVDVVEVVGVVTAGRRVGIGPLEKSFEAIGQFGPFVEPGAGSMHDAAVRQPAQRVSDPAMRVGRVGP